MDDLIKKELRRYIDSEIDFMKGIGASTMSCECEYDKYIIRIEIEDKSV